MCSIDDSSDGPATGHDLVSIGRLGALGFDARGGIEPGTGIDRLGMGSFALVVYCRAKVDEHRRVKKRREDRGLTVFILDDYRRLGLLVFEVHSVVRDKVFDSALEFDFYLHTL